MKKKPPAPQLSFMFETPAEPTITIDPGPEPPTQTLAVIHKEAPAAPEEPERPRRYLIDPDWFTFMDENHRVPSFGDKKQPWEYRGWLLYYCQIGHRTGYVGNRWGYLYETIQAGKLLEQSIPQVNFGHPDSGVKKEVLKWVRIIEERSGSYSALPDLIYWLGWALGQTRSEQWKKLDATINERLYKAVNLKPLLERPADYFGDLLAESSYGRGRGFFPTPQEVSSLMAKMVFVDEGKDLRSRKVMEPALGTGRMLMDASNYSLRLYGMELSELIWEAAMVNFCLYVPWAVSPIPESFFPEETAAA